MSAQAVLDELQGLGSAQTLATYRRHGVLGDAYGVSYAALGKLKKRIRTDHALALALWDSGNHDARILAMMVADPAKVSEAELGAWAAGVLGHVQAQAVANFAGRTAHAQRCVDAWKDSPEESTSATGWTTLAVLANEDATLPDAFFIPRLEQIEREIHGSANRVRQAMNNALMAIGIRGAGLAEQAIAAARRIGKVHVDHGDTACKTPDAEPYILKARARKA
ncbi:MAG: uncharacterized protein JWM27_3600 [Gemmatimonadetes bacterium]|nr:uncharacterized protein [Gemmatimonadota bacterium]